MEAFCGCLHCHHVTFLRVVVGLGRADNHEPLPPPHAPQGAVRQLVGLVTRPNRYDITDLHRKICLVLSNRATEKYQRRKYEVWEH